MKSRSVLSSSVWMGALSAAVVACDGTPTDIEPQGIRIVDYPRVMQVGDSFQLPVKVTKIDNSEVYYSPLVDGSPSKSIVGQVSATGMVVANSVGQFTIIVRSAMYGEMIDTASITVRPPPAERRLKFKSLTSNPLHSCGISVAGDTYCWGANKNGILGVPARSICFESVRPLPDKDCSVLPEKLSGAPSFVTLADVGAAYPDNGHICALTQAGDAYCWGANSYGQLGDRTTTGSNRPVAVSGFKFTSLSISGATTCGIVVGGQLYCWGLVHSPVGVGGLYDSSRCFREANCRVSPSAIAPELRFKSISLGTYHACAITDGDEAYCWGDNTYGELGDGTTLGRSEPVRVSSEIRFRSVTAGVLVSCGISVGGDAYCWGWDSWQQLGTTVAVQKDCNPFPSGSGAVLCARTPVKVALAEPASEIRPLRNGVCALSTSGRIYCWGQTGQTSATIPIPTAVDNITYKALVGSGDLCALDSQGFAYCWGYAFNSRGGNGIIGYASLPTPVEGPRTP